MTIIQAPDQALRQKSVQVQTIDGSIRALLADMAETLASAGGLGLAAVQVGVPKRLIVVRNGTEILKLVNPELRLSEGRQDSSEACLSLPGVFGIVRRPARVAVRAQDENGRPLELERVGLLAAAISHEVDHLEGILFTDKAGAVRRFRAGPPAGGPARNNR